jgi:hypothetical protein
VVVIRKALTIIIAKRTTIAGRHLSITAITIKMDLILATMTKKGLIIITITRKSNISQHQPITRITNRRNMLHHQSLTMVIITKVGLIITTTEIIITRSSIIATTVTRTQTVFLPQALIQILQIGADIIGTHKLRSMQSLSFDELGFER